MHEKDEVSVKVVKMLGNDLRIKILKHLFRRRYTASELAKLLNLSVPTVYYHLSLLEKSGFVRKIQSNRKWKYYELTKIGVGMLNRKVLKITILSIAITIISIFTLMKLSPFEAENTHLKSLGGTLTSAEIIFFTILTIVIATFFIFSCYKIIKE